MKPLLLEISDDKIAERIAGCIDLVLGAGIDTFSCWEQVTSLLRSPACLERGISEFYGPYILRKRLTELPNYLPYYTYVYLADKDYVLFLPRQIILTEEI